MENLPEDLIEFGNLREAARDYMINQLEDEWHDAERTDWHSIDNKPEHEGYYELQVKGYEDRLYEEFCEFKNGEWDRWDMEKIVAWRGLAEKPEGE